jgi:hypothetical protein
LPSELKDGRLRRLRQTGRKAAIVANLGSSLASEQCLNGGDYLVAANAQFFAIMQTDGNFVIYRGSDPDHQGTPIWATHTVDTRQYMGFSAVMQSDGNFVLYYGTGTGHAGSGARWASNTPQAEGSYVATLRDDGHLVLWQGTPTGPGDAYWDNQAGAVTPRLAILYGDQQSVPPALGALPGEGMTGEPVYVGSYAPLAVELTDSMGDQLSGRQVRWTVTGVVAPTLCVQFAHYDSASYLSFDYRPGGSPAPCTTATDSSGIAILSQLSVGESSEGEVDGYVGSFRVIASYGSAEATFSFEHVRY